MKLAYSDDSRFVFRISTDEKQVLVQFLAEYPMLAAGHHRVAHPPDKSKSSHDPEVLEAALTAHRLENRKQLQAWLADPGTFTVRDDGCLFTLSRPQCEWLLQVLNDLKVGCWVRLGSPDLDGLRQLKLRPETLRYLWLMDLSNGYQNILLEALSR